MIAIYRLALAPVLLRQAAWLRTTALRLPEAAGPRRGLAGDAAAEPGLRLLFVGDSSAAGVGVEHQDEALALPTARRLAARLGITVGWQLVARTGVDTAQAADLVAAADLEPADVLVTSLGTNDVTAQRAPRAFIESYRALLAVVAARAGARLAVVTGLPPMRILPAAPQPLRWYLGRCASRLDGRLRRWCAAREGCAYLPLDWAARPEEMAADRYHPGRGQYAEWSRRVAERVEALLGAPGRP